MTGNEKTFAYTYMMARQLVYLSLQRGGTTIDSVGPSAVSCVKVGLFQQKKKKNLNITLARMYVYTGR